MIPEQQRMVGSRFPEGVLTLVCRACRLVGLTTTCPRCERPTVHAVIFNSADTR